MRVYIHRLGVDEDLTQPAKQFQDIELACDPEHQGRDADSHEENLPCDAHPSTRRDHRDVTSFPSSL